MKQIIAIQKYFPNKSAGTTKMDISTYNILKTDHPALRNDCIVCDLFSQNQVCTHENKEKEHAII